MLNMNEWMKLWGLDPKTGLPTLWKLWWPWLDAEQPLFRMQVRMGSFPIQQSMATSRNVLKQVEAIEQPVNKQAPKVVETVKSAPVKTAAKTTAVKKAAAPKAAANKEAAPAAPAAKTTRAKAAVKPVTQADAVKTPVAAKPAAEKAAATKTTACKTTTTAAATDKKETVAAPKKTIAAVAKNATTAVKAAEPTVVNNPVAPVKAAPAEKAVAAKPVVAKAETVKAVATPAVAPKETAKPEVKVEATAVTAISAKTQQQIDQLGAAPNKEALRAAIRAVYAEKGAATAEQWGKWLHQNADVLNTLHLQPMAAAGEIKLQNTPTVNAAAGKAAE